MFRHQRERMRDFDGLRMARGEAEAGEYVAHASQASSVYRCGDKVSWSTVKRFIDALRGRGFV